MTDYTFHDIVIAQDASYGSGKPPTFVSVPGFIAVGTGLGYYIDLKPEEPRMLAEITVDTKTTQVFQEEDETRYCPTHLLSGTSLKYWFYTEEQCRQYIEEMVSFLDWTLPLEDLKNQPAFATIGTKARESASKITGKALL